MPISVRSLEADAALYAAIVQNSSDAIIAQSLDGTVRSWNPAAEALFGWSAEEMIGAPITRIIPASKLAEEEANLASVCRGEVVPRFRTERVTKTGDIVPIGVSISPVRDEHGTIIGVSKIASDLRAILRATSDLQRQTDQFTALADNIPQLAWIADKDGWIYWYNRRWHDYTGTTLEDMEGWGWRKVHHPDHVDRVVERIQKAWDTGEPWEDTFPLRRHDGVFRWFLSRANPLKDDNGNVVLWCGSNTDITEELESKNRIAMLMREVNHRCRNMLATIQTMINRTNYSTGEELTSTLSRRIAALASNQEILDGGDWTGARIADVMRAQIQHVGETHKDRIEMKGDSDIVIAARQAEALGLAIHELATNAEKYGALSIGSGSVAIAWSVTANEKGEDRLRISWQERGGPAVAPPLRKGFGTMLLTRNVEAAFEAKVGLEFPGHGLEWSLDCAADQCVIEEIERVET